MHCFDCKRACRKVREHLGLGGKRLFLPVPCGGCVIATILSVSTRGTVLIRSDSGEQSEISACKIPFYAFPAVS